MIDAEGGYGIGGYTYELSEGLAANGVEVDVYTNSKSEFHRLEMPRHHRVYPVLGGALFKQRRSLKQPITPSVPQVEQPMAKGSDGLAARGRTLALRSTLRGLILPAELAIYLKRQKYDLVWRQWGFGVYGSRFSTVCKSLGMRVVHTVHNVLPHEEVPSDILQSRRLYGGADRLIAHSNWAKGEIARLFPEVAHKVIVARLGLYTMFPRVPESRMKTRESLKIPRGKPVLLFFGGVRPYKNIDSLLTAMRRPELNGSFLIVAGVESGYDDFVPNDPLGRTRRIAQESGVAERIRFIPGPLDLRRTAEIMEASDILALPYLRSYGSALLLLGMTFGKVIAATRTGGMEEYLKCYPRHTLLNGPAPNDVAAAIASAISRIEGSPDSETLEMPGLMWVNIAREVLAEIG
jgi:glycosyltransferase involved in cell wall biosynthesis